MDHRGYIGAQDGKDHVASSTSGDPEDKETQFYHFLPQ